MGGAIALALLAGTASAEPRVAPFDLVGQVTGILAMTGLTLGAIEAGSHGFTDPTVVPAFALAVLALATTGLLPASAPLWLLAMSMVLVGLGGPTVSPPATALLLDTVASDQAGVASGVFNTSRQVGGALAVAVFGGLLADPGAFVRGVHTSLLTAAAVLALTAVLALSLPALQATMESHDHEPRLPCECSGPPR